MAQKADLSLKQLAKRIHKRVHSEKFKTFLSKLLLELCSVDTSPRAEPANMRRAEDEVFAILERELAAASLPNAQLRRVAINPKIEQHRFYSQPHFTRTAKRPQGLPASKVYEGRSNLVFQVPGSGEGKGASVALNAHVDVVAPYFPPRQDGEVFLGRGTCDDKGSVTVIVGALRVLGDLLRETPLTLRRNIVAMLVVEEETGGNGSLSLAMDRELKRLYDSVLVGECTGLKLHPANRGAVWYKAELHHPSAPLLELASHVILELEKEGAAIRAESRHDLFPQRPVQTCHGIIGRFGEHPSRICGKVVFTISFRKRIGRAAETLIRDCLDAAVAEYVGIYGDKAKVCDPQTGKPLVARHFDMRLRRNAAEVTVHGATGHMGSIRERDGAITKTAWMVNQLVRCRSKLEKIAGTQMTLELAGQSKGPLVLEGGQGFVPTHEIEEVMERITLACQRGAANHLHLTGAAGAPGKSVRVSFEKLHNAAFEGRADSLSMRHALEAARMARLPDQQPVLGWTVSCDARLFATEYPGMDVLTFGPGLLAHAHSDAEQVTLPELTSAVEFLALFLLIQTGTAKV